MSLLHIDSYIISIITSYLSGRDITMLYFTGNKHLLHLMNDGVKIFRHEDISIKSRKCMRCDCIPTPVIPNIIHKFTLQSFYSSCSRIDIYFDNQFKDLSVSQRTLTTLVIPYPCFHNTSLIPRSVTHLELKLSCITLDHIKQLPRGLKHLSISKLSSLDILNFPEDGLQYLPDTLTSLKVSCSSQSFISKLPRNIRKLYIELDIVNNTMQDLPCGLTHFTTSSHMLTDSAIEYLPRSVEYLSLSDVKIIGYNGILSLPHCLTHLSLPSVTTIKDDSIPHLPRGLHDLDLSHARKLTDSSIESLPRSLSHLSLDGRKLTDECVKFLPPNLTYLELKKKNSLTDRCVENLPRSITHLGLGRNNKLGDKCVSYLPRRITYLDLHANTNLADASMEHLPRGLTTLFLNSNKKITDNGFQYLRSLPLVFLNMRSNTKITDNSMRYLPDTLEVLYLSSNSNIFRCIPTPPRNLRELRINIDVRVTRELRELSKRISISKYDCGLYVEQICGCSRICAERKKDYSAWYICVVVIEVVVGILCLRIWQEMTG